jgi:hypothetical protein
LNNWRREWVLKVRPKSVLSDEQTLEARALAGQVSQRELAAHWGVSVWTVRKAQQGNLKTLAGLLAAAAGHCSVTNKSDRQRDEEGAARSRR